ncbi:MAG: hypothetical protein CVU84_02725 [Firmicutes bacterium HGW-Firmicutes-1]|jgi:undecaprenyl pyrophosphate phosphatase UppP|nr:MAG: hypothetical protein CVU84_02725 [Firmicutes bacterium HGW-Firmicutes-1]
MKRKIMKVIIVLLASIIAVVLGFVQNYSLERLSYTMLVVVVLFYIIGIVIQSIIDRTIKSSEALNSKALNDLEVTQKIPVVKEVNDQPIDPLQKNNVEEDEEEGFE